MGVFDTSMYRNLPAPGAGLPEAIGEGLEIGMRLKELGLARKKEERAARTQEMIAGILADPRSYGEEPAGGAPAPPPTPPAPTPRRPGGVPELQGGGAVAAEEPVIVGEQAPELFVPDRPGTVVPTAPASPPPPSAPPAAGGAETATLGEISRGALRRVTALDLDMGLKLSQIAMAGREFTARQAAEARQAEHWNRQAEIQEGEARLRALTGLATITRETLEIGQAARAEAPEDATGAMAVTNAYYLTRLPEIREYYELLGAGDPPESFDPGEVNREAFNALLGLRKKAEEKLFILRSAAGAEETFHGSEAAAAARANEIGATPYEVAKLPEPPAPQGPDVREVGGRLVEVTPGAPGSGGPSPMAPEGMTGRGAGGASAREIWAAPEKGAEPPGVTEQRQLAETYERQSAAFKEAQQWAVKARSAQNNSTGDNVRFVAFARALQPTGILSDRDVAAVQGGTIPEWIQARIASLIGSGTMTDAKRRNLERQTALLLKEGAAAQRRIEERTAAFAQAHGYDPTGLYTPYADEGVRMADEMISALGAPEEEGSASGPADAAPRAGGGVVTAEEIRKMGAGELAALRGHTAELSPEAKRALAARLDEVEGQRER